MTPLFHRLVKRLTVPAKRREPLYDPHGLLADLKDVHCFEMTEALGLVDILTKVEGPGQEEPNGTDRPIFQMSDDLFFPPAPNTWLEWQADGPLRLAMLMRDQHNICIVRGCSCGCEDLQALRLLHEGTPIENDIVAVYMAPWSSIHFYGPYGWAKGTEGPPSSGNLMVVPDD